MYKSLKSALFIFVASFLLTACNMSDVTSLVGSDSEKRLDIPELGISIMDNDYKIEKMNDDFGEYFALKNQDGTGFMELFPVRNKEDYAYDFIKPEGEDQVLAAMESYADIGAERYTVRDYQEFNADPALKGYSAKFRSTSFFDYAGALVFDQKTMEQNGGIMGVAFLASLDSREFQIVEMEKVWESARLISAAPNEADQQSDAAAEPEAEVKTEETAE